MAVVSFTISGPDIDLFARSFNYQSTIPDPNNSGQTIPNPENENVFARKSLISFMKERIKSQKQYEAIIAANITDANIT